MSALEKQRTERMAHNKKRLAELGLEAAAQQQQAQRAAAKKARPAQATGNRKRGAAPTGGELEPPRRSGRVRADVSYVEASMAEVLAKGPVAEVSALAVLGGLLEGQSRHQLPQTAGECSPRPSPPLLALPSRCWIHPVPNHPPLCVHAHQQMNEREPLPEYNPPTECVVSVPPTFVDASAGARNARGRLVFADHPDFT